MITIEAKPGPPVLHGGRRLIPIAKSLKVRFPRGLGGLVWNRAVGITIEEGDERTFLRIADPTRRLQWLLLGAGAVLGMLLQIDGRRRRRGGRPLPRRRA